MSMIDTPPPLLAVEDSDEDFTALTWAMRQLGLDRPMVRCAAADDALDYLFARGRHRLDEADAIRRPSLVLLDLNLPPTGGAEVLRRIKADGRLCTVPVVVWTTSALEDDVQRCYRLGANSYILKRFGVDRLLQDLRVLTHYWFDMAVIPDGGIA